MPSAGLNSPSFSRKGFVGRTMQSAVKFRKGKVRLRQNAEVKITTDPGRFYKVLCKNCKNKTNLRGFLPSISCSSSGWDFLEKPYQRSTFSIE